MEKDLIKLDHEFNDIETINKMKKVLKLLTKQHKNISRIKTPKGLIKQKMGMDYVELDYMKRMADNEFPGWSWQVVEAQLIGDKAFMVHGRLKWLDNGIGRSGDVTAAHRIQKKKGSDEYVDIGNDIKAANTDAMKKAFNVFMNIADDVYRNIDIELSDKEKKEIINAAQKISSEMEDKIEIQIENCEINKQNYETAMRRLHRLAMEKNNEKST